MQGPNALSHLLTFGGHAVAAAAALKNIEIIQREGLVERAAEMGQYLLAGLRALVDSHPTVGDARGLGLLCAIELVKDKTTKEKWARDSDFIKRLHALVNDRRLLTRVWEILHIAPPLVVTRAEIDQILTILDESLAQVEQEFGLR
jgi:adenosylmethionine-8-amino-7-oxononanoate aminotransferase